MKLDVKLERRATPHPLMALLYPALAIILGLLIGAFFIVAAGADPIKAYEGLVYGAFGDIYYITETLIKTAPLLFASLGITVAFRCQVWNIGAEGQLYAGALAATWLGLSLVNIPALPHLFLMIFIGFLAGAIFGSISGVLKAKLHINEIISTIMLNYIILYFVSYILHGPWKDPVTLWPESRPIAPTAIFPVLMAGTRLHAGVLLAFICVPLIHVFLNKSVLGYRIKAVGTNPAAARFGGVSVAKSVILAMVISGGLAGLAGMNEVCGIQYRLRTDISPGYGYTAIIVAMLGKLHPVGVMLASVFFAALINGADLMYRVTGIPVALVSVLQGIVLLSVIGCEVLSNYRVKVIKGG